VPSIQDVVHSYVATVYANVDMSCDVVYSYAVTVYVNVDMSWGDFISGIGLIMRQARALAKVSMPSKYRYRYT